MGELYSMAASPQQLSNLNETKVHEKPIWLKLLSYRLASEAS